MQIGDCGDCRLTGAGILWNLSAGRPDFLGFCHIAVISAHLLLILRHVGFSSINIKSQFNWVTCTAELINDYCSLSPVLALNAKIKSTIS